MTRRAGRVRPARPADAESIADLVAEFAGPGYLLPRTLEDIRGTIDSWFVARRGEQLLACGSLLPYSDALAEVRSLAVAPRAQGRGLGGLVLRALIEEGRRRRYGSLFALTRAVDFFESHGFQVGQRVEFPQKVWRDCMACPFIDDCDETAVVLDLTAERAETEIPYSMKGRGVSYVQERR